MATIQRQLAANQGNLYISRFWTGLVKQRQPLFSPLSSMGLQVIARQDAFWDGLNVEISSINTPVRRPGFSRYSTSQLTPSQVPRQFFSFQNTSGTIKAMVDLGTQVSWFNTTSVTTVFDKASANQISFCKVGDQVYMCNQVDTDSKKWDGTTVRKWGIAGPVTAPGISIPAGSLSPTIGYLYGYAFKCSATGGISSMSPASANTGPQTSKNFTLTGATSTDAQVDTVQIYRNLDGGSTYGLLAEVSLATWTASGYTDSSPDSSVNTLINPALASSNNPPPSGSQLAKFHQGRIWIANGNHLNFGAGPDCLIGIPEEAFPPANRFTLPGYITALVSTSFGLIVFTSDDAYIVLGNDLASFTVQPWQANFGVTTHNCVTQDGDLVFIFTSRKQLFQIDPSNGIVEIGYNIRSLLGSLFSPGSTYLAIHRNGDDEGLFIADGNIGSIFRYSIAMQCWSPINQPIGGLAAIGSIEVTTSDWQLMMGRSSGSGYLLTRNLDSSQDDGASYDAFFTVGSIVVAPPGEVATIESVLLQATPIGTYPTVSVLLNEVSGTFTDLIMPVPEPPNISPSKTVISKRHYLSSAQDPLPRAAIQHLQVKVHFKIENARNQILGLGLS